MNVVALAKAIAEHRGVRHESLIQMVQSGVVRCAELELTGYRFSSELQPQGTIALYQEVSVVEAVNDAKAETTVMEASLAGLDEVQPGDELVFRVLHEDEAWDRSFLKQYESLRPLRRRSIAQPVAAFLSEGSLRPYLSESSITTPLGDDALWTRKDRIVADFDSGGLGTQQIELDYVLGELLLAAASLEAVEDRILRLENLLFRLDNAELDLRPIRFAIADLAARGESRRAAV